MPALDALAVRLRSCCSLHRLDWLSICSHVAGSMYCSGAIGLNGAMTCRIVSVARLAFAIATASVVNAFREAFEKSDANRIRRVLAIDSILS